MVLILISSQFLSMKLAAVNLSRFDFNVDESLAKEV
jgi:hypothetical protein